MSRMRRMWTATPFCALLCGITPAATPLSAQMLHESCRAYAEAPESPQALFCAGYIQGYLDSARSSAEQLTEAVQETWEERAARTRLGKSRYEALRKRDRRYCVAESVGLPQIIEQLLEYLRTHPPDPQTPAAEALSSTLSLQYSCNR